MYAKQRKREGNLFLFVWKRYAPVNGSAAIRMFARNERSTLFSACITICSIRSRQSLKLFDARVIDAPPPPSPPPPAPPSHHRRRHRCYPRRTAIGHSSVQQPPSIRPHLSDWRPHYEYCILWLRMSTAPCNALCSTGKVIYPHTGHKENIVKSMRAPSSCL